MKPRGLRHLSLRTRNLERAERFYTEVLGLRVAFRERGMVAFEGPRRDDVLNFTETHRRFDPAAGGLDHFGLRFDRRAFARVREEIRAAGVPVIGRRGSWALYIRDPDGYTVELFAD